MQIVYGGNEAFDALLYRNNPHNQAHQAYLGARLESMSNSNPAMANTEFFQRAKQMYDRIYSSEAMTIARAAIAQVGHIFQEDNIRFLNTLVDIQNAPQTMQRWIMANPVERSTTHNNVMATLTPTKMYSLDYWGSITTTIAGWWIMW